MIVKKLFKNNSSFAKDSFLLTISKIITGVISLVVTMILSHGRTLEEYGTYSQLMVVINLVTSIMMLGLPNSISFFLGRSKDKQERKNFLSSYFVLNSILTLLSGCIMTACIIPISSYFKNSSIYSYWFFLLLYPWAFVTSSCIENLTVASGKTSLLIPFKISHSVLLLAATGISVWIKMPFQLYILLVLLVEACFAFTTYVIAYRLSDGFYLQINRKMIFTIFAFSLPIGLASAVGTLNAEIDKFVIGKLMSTEDVAVYTNASKDLPIILIPTAITAALLPRVSKAIKNNDIGNALFSWKRSIIFSFAFVSLFSFGCFVFADDIINFLYGQKYLPGISVFRVFCILLLFRTTYWGLLLNASGNTKFIFFSSLFSFAVNAALNIPFYFAFGMVGCAISTLISTATISFIQLIFTSRKLKIRFSCIFPWKEMGLILLSNFTFGVFFYKLKDLLALDQTVGSFFESLILGIIWACLFFAILFLILKERFKAGVNENENPNDL